MLNVAVEAGAACNIESDGFAARGDSKVSYQAGIPPTHSTAETKAADKRSGRLLERLVVLQSRERRPSRERKR